MVDTKISDLTDGGASEGDELIPVAKPQGTSPETYVNQQITADAIGTRAVSANKAAASDIRAGTADKVVTADGIESAAEFVTLSDGATISFDWSTGINFDVTLGGNRVIDEPTNPEPGTMRLIRVIQDGTGSRTLTWGNNSPAEYQFAGGAQPTLTTTPGAVDVFSVLCVTTSLFYVFTVGQDMG